MNVEILRWMVPLSTANVTENNHNGGSFIKKLFLTFIYIPLNRLYESVFFSVWLTFSEMRNYTLKSSTLCVSCHRITRDHYPISETQNYYRFINCFYWCKRSDNGTTCLTNKNYYNEVKFFNLFNDSGGNYYLSGLREKKCKICCYPWYSWWYKLIQRVKL